MITTYDIYEIDIELIRFLLKHKIKKYNYNGFKN